MYILQSCFYKKTDYKSFDSYFQGYMNYYHSKKKDGKLVFFPPNLFDYKIKYA